MPSNSTPPAAASLADQALITEVRPSPGLWQPSSRALRGMPPDISLGAYTSTSAPTSGTIYVVRVRLDTAGVVSNVIVPITTQAAATPSDCFVGVYDPATLEQLAVSADQSASWVSPGTKTVALAAPTVAQAAGADLYVGFLYVGSSLALRAAAATPLVNLGLQCMGTAGTVQTALPASLGAISASTTPLFFAVS